MGVSSQSEWIPSQRGLAQLFSVFYHHYQRFITKYLQAALWGTQGHRFV